MEQVDPSGGDTDGAATQVLDDVRVIDLSTTVAGSVATMLLADHGAEVIKVEPPTGDPVRAEPAAVVWNRNKHSVVLDLHQGDERRRLLELVAAADVVVDTFAPTTREGLGVDHATLARHGTGLVTCSITGYGPIGEDRDRDACDALVQARTGLQYEQPGRRDGPVFLHAPLPSMGAALLATLGVSTALRVREVTGLGQAVETSLVQGSLVWTTQIWNRASQPTGPLTEMWRDRDLGPTPCFEGSDGRWFHPMINGIAHALVHVGREPDELDLGAVIHGDRESRAAFFAAARELFRQRPRDEWVELFQRRDVSCQPVQPAEDVFDHPQLRPIGGMATVDVPEVGPVTQLGHTYDLGLHTHRAPAPGPRLGQQTGALLDLLGSSTRPAIAPTGPIPDHPLQGVRVIDLGTVVAGPFGTMVLADLGAEVIKVDPRSAAVGTPGDATWASSNRGKRSIALDLKSDEGRDVLRRLIEGADVLHNNLRTGVAERLGFDHAHAATINPRIISCRLTAYGELGPLARWPGSDQMAQALCGLEHEQGATPAGGHPTWLRFGMTDAAAGLLSAIGVVQALYDRDRTGLGQEVRTDILRAGLLLASDAFVGPPSLPRRRPLDRAQTGTGPWRRLYETADGWICVAADSTEQRLALGAAAEVDVSPDDAEVGAALEAALRERGAQTWARQLDAAGVPCEIARDLGSAWADDPLLVANGWVGSWPHPVWGRLQQPGPFLDLSTTPVRLRSAPPVVGQHTEEVLGELGYTGEEIESWRSRGLIGT